MRTASKFFQTMTAQPEKDSQGDEIGLGQAEQAGSQNIKVGQLKKLNDYINPILTDMDPSQYIEDEYKHYHQPVFCWRFRRTLCYLDQSSFIQKKGATTTSHGQDGRVVKLFKGDVEELAVQIHEQAKKREINQVEEENGDDAAAEGRSNEAS